MEGSPRYLETTVRTDLRRKMVFLSGARQVGKTTLARRLLAGSPGYLNWDVASDRAALLANELPPAPLWVLDEIHKYPRWRNYLKGLFDGREKGHQILVTGSARLEFYRRGGDSLQGRYHLLRLHPLSAAELGTTTVDGLRQLMTLGGFPEPFFGGSEVQARRWSREYRNLLVREELASLERVQDLAKLELLMQHLPERVGSPLSINSLREDLEASHKAVASWIAMLERLFAIFRLPPFGAPKLRAVKKEQKHYHLDWTLVQEPGPRFENLVAAHLAKWVDYQQDVEGREVELRYFRDVDAREVDFVVVERRKPILAVECKLGDDELGRGLRYFKERFPSCEAWQLSLEGKKDYVGEHGIRVAPALALLTKLV